jgi:regulatory protein
VTASIDYLYFMNKSVPSYTLEQAKEKLERYCAYQERSHKQIEQQLYKMRMIPQAQEVLITHLIQHNFLNESRFAQAYSRGKFRIKKWGKKRITQGLKQHGVSAYNIKLGLAQIDPEAYRETFDALVEKRLNDLTSEKNILKKKRKLLDYLAYRGWETELIYEALSRL